MPGIVARIGGPAPAAREMEEVLGFLRHFAFYESAGLLGPTGWLGWVGVGAAGQRLQRDGSRQRIVAYHGDGAAHHDAQERAARADGIASLIEERPADLADLLGGSFAAACLDLERGSFACLTDRFGHHRVYYRQINDALYLSCELKGFLAWPDLPIAPDPEALCDLINYSYPLGDRTSLEGVRLLQPASLLRFRDGRLSVARYWRPRYHPVEGDDDELCAEGHRLFRESFTAKAARAPRWILPVSGGLDSRLLLARALDDGKPMVTYTYGHARSTEARVACDLMRRLGLEPTHIVTDDFPGAVEAVRRAVWFGEGMVNATIAHLASLLGTFAAEPRDALYLNGIYGGPTNFSNGYHRPDELVADMPRERKVARIGATMFSHLLHSARNYRKLTPEFARRCDESYDRRIDRLLDDYEKVSPLFGHQKDAFYIDNRLCRFMNQVDLNRYFWDETIPLTSNALYDFYLRLPDRLKFGRLLHKRMLARYYPEAADVEVFATGLTVHEELAGRRAPGLDHRGDRWRHYLRRLTAGRWDRPEPWDFRSHDYHHRRNEELRRFYEDVLGDESLLAADCFDTGVVRGHLRAFRRGSPAIGTLATVMAWELWLRQLRARRWDA